MKYKFNLALSLLLISGAIKAEEANQAHEEVSEVVNLVTLSQEINETSAQHSEEVAANVLLSEYFCGKINQVETEALYEILKWWDESENFKINTMPAASLIATLLKNSFNLDKGEAILLVDTIARQDLSEIQKCRKCADDAFVQKVKDFLASRNIKVDDRMFSNSF